MSPLYQTEVRVFLKNCEKRKRRKERKGQKERGAGRRRRGGGGGRRVGGGQEELFCDKMLPKISKAPFSLDTEGS